MTKPTLTAISLNCLVFSCIIFAEKSSATETRVVWTNQPPCDIAYAEQTPNSPMVGLGLFKFECPNSPPQFISGMIQQKPKQKYIATMLVKRGAKISEIQYKTEPGEWVGKSSEMPINIDDKAQQSRTQLSPGAPLHAKDFEPLQLWTGGEAIVIRLTIGNVFTSLDGTAISSAKINQHAKAKTATGKILQGIASLCDEKPCLTVKQ